VCVPRVSSNSEIDRAGLECFRGRRPANPARVLLTRVFGNRSLLLGRATGIQLADALRKRPHVLRIVLPTPVRRALPNQGTSLAVRQAFPLRPRKPCFVDQHALSLIALPRPAEADDESTQCRVATGSAGERGISTLKEHEMIEVGAGQAKGPVSLQPEETPLPKFLVTFRAD